MKKLTALLLALVMVLAMNASALAATGDYKASEGTKTTVSANNITLTKTIVYFNPDGTSVREPSLTYQYSITPATVGSSTTVTDKDGHSATVKAGITTDGAISSMVSIAVTPGEAVTASATGTPKEYNTVISVNPTKFPSAGIYRYTITEDTTDADIEAAGVTRASSTNNEIRYLDVYIKNEGTGLALMGAVIFKTNNSIDGETTTTPAVTTDKTTGFDVKDSSDTDYKDDNTVDKYFTYNLKVSKTISGTLADKTHPFPFVIALTDAVANVTVDIALTNTSTHATYTGGNTAALSSGALNVSADLADGDYITISGLPTGTKVTVKETNNTSDTYTLTGTTVAGTSTVGTVITNINQTLVANDNYTSGEVKVDGNGTTSEQYKKTEIGYTNTLAEVSQTGVVLRFAPYALMLGAGVALFIILKVRKNKAVEED